MILSEFSVLCLLYLALILQEPETEICGSMLESLNECIQVVVTIVVPV